MSLPLAALIVLLLLAVWLFHRRRKASSTEETRPAWKSNTPTTAYHAVSIKFSGSACKAARDMEGRRFLSSAAPKLPLPDCDVLECACRFAHHKDRRARKDRRSPFAASGFGGGTGSFQEEKREGRDRRRQDDDLL